MSKITREKITEMRDIGATWADIGAVFGITRQSATYHAQKLHCYDTPKTATDDRPAIFRLPTHDDIPPLPAGSAITWGAITDGTVLDGSAYPFPVFRSCDREPVRVSA